MNKYNKLTNNEELKMMLCKTTIFKIFRKHFPIYVTASYKIEKKSTHIEFERTAMLH